MKFNFVISGKITYFVPQSTFMATGTSTLDTLKDIKKMMEKSSRFISLSGWSGIAAGVCGLVGAFYAQQLIGNHQSADGSISGTLRLVSSLFITAAIVFVCAFASAFLFTLLRSRREGVAVWGSSAKRLLWNTMVPMIAGGVVVLRLIDTGNYDLVAPCTLIFYGLALINGSKYTLGEIRYLGYIEIVLGAINLWYPQYWLILWTLGFGVMHIVYGIIMWWRYERNPSEK